MTWIDALLLVAVLLNTYAFLRHELARRRLLARIAEQHARLVELMPVIGFVAFISQEESGAPERVRQLAREALPESVRVTVEAVPPESERVH